MAILNEIRKNMKIIFRNWTSISLLVLAPLLLILLVGYAFSNDAVSGIRIGVVMPEGLDLSSLAQNVSKTTLLIRYTDLPACIADVKTQHNHLCIRIEGFSEEGLKTGAITYYYDNSRKRLSLILIQNIKEFFGASSEELSIEAAGEMISQIQELVVFIDARRDEITNITTQAEGIKADIMDHQAKLIKVRSEFMPLYTELKSLQLRIHESADAINASLESLIRAAEPLDSISSAYSSPLNASFFNESLILLNTSFFDDLAASVDALEAAKNGSLSNIQDFVVRVDAFVFQADQIKFFLDDEITKSDEYVRRIDESTARVGVISQQLDEEMESLADIDPDLAKKLIRPLSHTYEQILSDVTNIQLSFPLLLVMIIMFIALLFANIITVSELSSRAYLRNIIAPVDDVVYMLGLLITTTIIVFIQICVLFLIGQVKFGIPITHMLLPLSILAILLIMVFSLVGMLCAYVFSNSQTAVLLTTFIGLLFFLFSNAMAPIESMPGPAQFLASSNPVTIGTLAITQVQVYQQPLDLVFPQVLLLFMYVLFLLFAVIIASKARKQ